MASPVTRQQVAAFRRAFDGPLDSLAAIYRNATGDMLSILADAGATAGQKRRATALLRQYQRRLVAMNQEAALWVELEIPRSYRIGMEFADDGMERITKAGVNLGKRQSEVFAMVHEQAVAAAVDSMLNPLGAAAKQIGRRVNDVFRRVGSEEVAKGIAEGKTRLEVSKAIQERLIAEGQPYFADRLGRRWELDAYTEMVGRTTTREAATQGTINRLKEHNVTLAMVSSHGANDFCSYYEGKIVDLGGDDPRYPGLDAINGGPPFHPSCRHVLTPFVEELADEGELESGIITKQGLLDKPPAALQKRFAREYPARAKAEALRLRVQGAKNRSLRVKRAERRMRTVEQREILRKAA